MQLKQWLILYSRHRTFLYINYFENLILLIKWLGVDKCSESGLITSAPKWYEGNYEVQELSKHLGVSQAMIFKTLKEIDHG